MRELVTLHFGQAGVQLGNSTWELLCLEHAINEQGIVNEDSRSIGCLETFFSSSHKGNMVPRSIFIDLEPSVIDEIRKGSYRDLFHPDRLISGPEDAANNFARGFFTVGKLIINTINYELRKVLESCSNIHGLLIFRGLGGGTGSGLTSAIIDNLADLSKTYKLDIPIYPSAALCSSTVEPYNCLLAQHFCMEEIDIGLLFDNEASYDVCNTKLKQQSVTFSLINRLIAQVCSNLTVSIRFENTISSDLSVLQNNLVPYPRIHFPLCSYAPMIPESHNKHSSIVISELTKSVFDPETQLLKVDRSFGKVMSCALNYRGDVSPYSVYKALMEIKGKKMIDFVDWCPTGFRVGINLCPPTVVPDSGLVKSKRNVTLLTNSSVIGQAWQRLTHKFYMLYSKKSFIHWFVGEGMEESEFNESLYNISSLIKDYEECVIETNRTEENIENANTESQNKKASTKSYVKDDSNIKKQSLNNIHSPILVDERNIENKKKASHQNKEKNQNKQSDNISKDESNYKKNEQSSGMDFLKIEKSLEIKQKEEKEHKEKIEKDKNLEEIEEETLKTDVIENQEKIEKSHLEEMTEEEHQENMENQEEDEHQEEDELQDEEKNQENDEQHQEEEKGEEEQKKEKYQEEEEHQEEEELQEEEQEQEEEEHQEKENQAKEKHQEENEEEEHREDDEQQKEENQQEENEENEENKEHQEEENQQEEDKENEENEEENHQEEKEEEEQEKEEENQEKNKEEHHQEEEEEEIEERQEEGNQEENKKEHHQEEKEEEEEQQEEGNQEENEEEDNQDEEQQQEEENQQEGNIENEEEDHQEEKEGNEEEEIQVENEEVEIFDETAEMEFLKETEEEDHLEEKNEEEYIEVRDEEEYNEKVTDKHLEVKADMLDLKVDNKFAENEMGEEYPEKIEEVEIERQIGIEPIEIEENDQENNTDLENIKEENETIEQTSGSSNEEEEDSENGAS